ncbi:class I SAM-dependent methyltransferase [Prochlorococcus sp. MIT 1300]|uniref:class I SAM-dependent methyltransferase n=1 Tax=Prochlorococcus sp. MIT 1300 TaxID=3096218 RepID=UPI002A763FAE|nr:methyltransferase domain-containing protein [Prochlorococcus sp. MIT 1300]
MDDIKCGVDIDLQEFLNSGFHLKNHLADYLHLNTTELDKRLLSGSKDLAALHPGSVDPGKVISFYESEVGCAHLIELAAWHLGSADYIADTLRLQKLYSTGKVLDFGGGIGTHSLFAAALPEVEKVWYVDLNPSNREFVSSRANALGLSKKISIHRDLESTGEVLFDTIICLDVLEHLSDPSSQLLEFANRMTSEGTSLMNWYFFKGQDGEYPFHFDDPALVQKFFITLQAKFIEVFHPLLITTRAYKHFPQ